MAREPTPQTVKCEEVLQQKIDELSEALQLLAVLVVRRGGVVKISAKEVRLLLSCLISRQNDGSVVLRVVSENPDDVTEDV